MKITIELSDIQVKAMKAYLKEVGDNPRPNKNDITVECRGAIEALFDAPQSAVNDYYIQELNKG
jgi:hypothetical protein